MREHIAREMNATPSSFRRVTKVLPTRADDVRITKGAVRQVDNTTEGGMTIDAGTMTIDVDTKDGGPTIDAMFGKLNPPAY